MASNDSPASRAEIRAKQLARLRPTQWKKGQSGNPRGRTPDAYTLAIKAALPPDEFAEIVTKAAREGDSRIINALMDRHYPKPEVAVKLEASGPDGGPVRSSIRVTFVKSKSADT